MSLFAQFELPDGAADADVVSAVAVRVGDAEFAARAAMRWRRLSREEVSAASELVTVSRFAVAVGAVCAGSGWSEGAAVMPGVDRPSDDDLVGATAALLAWLPTAVAAFDGAGARWPVPAPDAVDDVLRRSSLVVAHTESLWPVVSAAGWLSAVAVAVAGRSADPASAAFGLSAPFSAADAQRRGGPPAGVRAGVPLDPTPPGPTLRLDRWRRRRRVDPRLSRPLPPGR
jgi:hypothetical protein